MTDRVYYTDSYCQSFEARVTRVFEHEGRPCVSLDRTAFYPTSGGQPHDIGHIGSSLVVDVVDLDDGIAHVLASPAAFDAGAMVDARVDWARRFDHMQQHTGQHLLSAAFDATSDNRTVSFHMGADESTIDLAREASAAEIEHAVDHANRVVWEDRPVSVRFVSAAEAETLPLRKEPARQGTLRLVEIGDCDLSACGGTHVGRTGAIGLIAVTRGEKVRGGTRVSFVCGERALRMFRTYRDAVAGSLRVLSVLPADLPAAVERSQNEAKDLGKVIRGLQEQLAAHEAVRLRTKAPEIRGVRVVVDVLDGWDATGLKAVATEIVAGSSAAVALVSGASPLFLVIARSQDVALDANAILKKLLTTFGGRGGGNADLAQGGGVLASPSEATSEAKSVIRSALER